MEVKSIRGNLQTRLRKLDEGEYAGLILAAAGLKRLGLENRIKPLLYSGRECFLQQGREFWQFREGR